MGATKVPLLRWAHGTVVHKRFNGRTQLPLGMPTILELVRINISSWREGKRLASLVRINISSWIFNITSKNSEIINYAILGANITSKYFWGIFICNGPVAFRNGILSRIIGQPRAFFIGSDS